MSRGFRALMRWVLRLLVAVPLALGLVYLSFTPRLLNHGDAWLVVGGVLALGASLGVWAWRAWDRSHERCVSCASTIRVEARVCRHCKAEQPPIA